MPPPSVRVDRPQTLALQHQHVADSHGDQNNDAGAEDEELAEIEAQIEKLEVAPLSNTPTPRKVNNYTRSSLSFGNDNAAVQERKTPSHLTEQGHFDLKFYSHKLW